jgi:hypothetical protein
MALLCYRRHRFPPEIIQHAIWLYLRFALSYRDVEQLLAERGLDLSYETVRRWVLKFGPVIARRLRRRRRRPFDPVESVKNTEPPGLPFERASGIRVISLLEASRKERRQCRASQS